MCGELGSEVLDSRRGRGVCVEAGLNSGCKLGDGVAHAFELGLKGLLGTGDAAEDGHDVVRSGRRHSEGQRGDLEVRVGLGHTLKVS